MPKPHLDGLLTAVVDKAVQSDKPKYARHLATLFERLALRLRQRHGGKTFLEPQGRYPAKKPAIVRWFCNGCGREGPKPTDTLRVCAGCGKGYAMEPETVE